jgi:hypothetical protein
MVSELHKSDNFTLLHLNPRYQAIKIWNELLTKPDSEYWVQLSPGTVLSKLVLFVSACHIA